MRKIFLLILLTPLLAQAQSIHTLIDIVPKYDAPYCTQYDKEEIPKFYERYSKNKLMATIEDTTGIEKNVIYAEILDRDAQLRLDSGLVRNHLLKKGERLFASDPHTGFFAYFAEAFVIDVNAFYGIIVEKVMVKDEKLTSEKYFCTINRDGRLIDKVSVLKSPVIDQSPDEPTKACIKNNSQIEMLAPSGKQILFQIDPTGKISTP